MLGEITYDLNDKFTLMAAGRQDFHEFTDSVLSPRLALVADYDKNIYKVIWQQSTTALLYAADELGTTVDPEVATNYEFIYTRLHNEKLRLDVSTYMTDVEIIAWSGDRTASIGDLQLWGTDVELTYKTEQLKFWISHSYNKQLDFKRNADGRQGVSFSDYYYDNSKENLVF